MRKLLSTRNKFTAVVAVFLTLVFVFPALSAWREQLTIGELTVETEFTAPTGSVGTGEIEDGSIVNADISNSAEIAITKIGNGTDAQIPISTAAGAAVAWKTMSGDSSIDNSGAVVVGKINGVVVGDTTAAAGSILISDNDSYEVQPISGDITLDADGVTVVAKVNGVILGVTTASSGSILISDTDSYEVQPISGDITLDADGVTVVAKINGIALGDTAASSGRILIGDGADWDGKVITGDITLSEAGATVVAKVNGVTLGDTAAASGQFLVGDGSEWQSVACSGDISCTSAGVMTVDSDKIGAAELHTTTYTYTLALDDQGITFTVNAGAVHLSTYPVSGVIDTNAVVAHAWTDGATTFDMNTLAAVPASTVFNTIVLEP